MKCLSVYFFNFKKMSNMKYYMIFFIFVFAYSCNSNKPPADNKSIGEDNNSEPSIVEPNGNFAGELKGNFNSCSYENNNNSNSIKLYTPGSRELDQINAILKFTGLNSNYSIYAADIKNAMAVIINNKRYILYDPRLLSYTDNSSGNFWTSMSILAHEIGHHLSGHTLNKSTDSHKDELEADKFSGFVLYKMGASLIQAKTAINLLGTQTDSESHPGKEKRFYAIEQGWNEANQQRFSSAIPPQPKDEIDGSLNNVIQEFNWQDFMGCADNMGKGLSDALNYALTHESTYIGIIIEAVDKPATNEETAYTCPGYRKDLVVEISEIIQNLDGHYVLKKGDRIEINVEYFPYGFAKSHFEIIFKPGRKILFRTFQYVREINSLLYVKRLNRNSDLSDYNLKTQNISGVSPSETIRNTSSTFVVTNSKAFFYNSPDFTTRRKGYLVYGEVVNALKKENGFIFVNFTNARGQTSTGWIALGDVNRQ